MRFCMIRKESIGLSYSCTSMYVNFVCHENMGKRPLCLKITQTITILKRAHVYIRLPWKWRLCLKIQRSILSKPTCIEQPINAMSFFIHAYRDEMMWPYATQFQFSLLPSFCLSLPLLHSSQIVWQINHPSILQEGLLCSRWCQCKHLEGAYLVSRLTISVDSRIENINSNRKGKNTLLDLALPPPSYHPSFQSKA